MVRQEHSDNPQQLELLRVCRIGRAQGLKGEVNVFAFTDDPEYRFAPGSVLYTQDGSREFVVNASRSHKNRWILHFDGVNDRNASEALNGIELFGEPDDPEDMAEEDAWYPRDLIGLEARMDSENQLGRAADEVIGTVVDVLDGAAQSLLKIRLSNPTTDERTVLVPFVDALVPEINLDEGYLTLDPPGGLIPGL